MKLGKGSKILIGILTLWPPLYLFLFMTFIFVNIFSTFSNPAQNKPDFDAFRIIFALHFVTILLTFGLVAFYLVYLFRTEIVPKDKKALWAAVLFLGNMVAMPVFWFLYIWREPKSNAFTYEQGAGAG